MCAAIRDGGPVVLGFTLLLERARPGEPLLHSGLSWEQILTELGRLARRLHGPARHRRRSCP